jgi:ribosomal protein L39E
MDFSIIYSFFSEVEIPKGTYKGQKLMKLVIKKMMAKAPKTNAAVPSIAFVKYKTPIAIAKIMREILSIEPMFFFMILEFSWLIIKVFLVILQTY